jgi:hypothetical protein
VKFNATEYTITLDSPPLLIFANEHSGDLVAVDTAQHAAVMVFRVLDKQLAGTKVCHGVRALPEKEPLRTK